jgi:hypothetical protein
MGIPALEPSFLGTSKAHNCGSISYKPRNLVPGTPARIRVGNHSLYRNSYSFAIDTISVCLSAQSYTTLGQVAHAMKAAHLDPGYVAHLVENPGFPRQWTPMLTVRLDWRTNIPLGQLD